MAKVELSERPLQLVAGSLRARSDVYSLGVLLYELSTGTTPFDKATLREAGFDEIRRIIREQEPPKPSDRLGTVEAASLSTISEQRGIDPRKLTHTLRGDLDWIVMKALEKDRTRRYQSAAAFADDAQRYLNGAPVEACPPSKLYRLRKFAGRNKGLLTTMLLIALLLVAGTAVSTWQALRARTAEADALAAWNAEARRRHRAETERANAEAVLNFFQDKVLAAGRPEGEPCGLGYHVTLREAVDAAEPQIAAAFQDRPLIEASVRHVLGATYRHLGEYGLAIRQLQRAAEIRTSALGPEHLDTLNSMNSLAVAFHAVAGKNTLMALVPFIVETRLDPMARRDKCAT